MRQNTGAVGLAMFVFLIARAAFAASYTYTTTDNISGSPGATASPNGTDGSPAVLLNGDSATFNGGVFYGGNGGDGFDVGTLVTQGGNGGAAVLATNTSIVSINAGGFNGGSGGFAVSSSTMPNITGNGGDSLDVETGSIVNVSGGTFNPGDPGPPINNATPGVAGYSFNVTGASVLTLYGTFASNTPITGGSGSFSGTLENNGFEQTFTYNVSGRQSEIEFVAVPEPASGAILSLGALMMQRRRRR